MTHYHIRALADKTKADVKTALEWVPENLRTPELYLAALAEDGRFLEKENRDNASFWSAVLKKQ